MSQRSRKRHIDRKGSGWRGSLVRLRGSVRRLNDNAFVTLDGFIIYVPRDDGLALYEELATPIEPCEGPQLPLFRGEIGYVNGFCVGV